MEVQECLVEFGYLEVVNGLYDELTVEAVKNFQTAHNLKVDGICGNETLKILFGY